MVFHEMNGWLAQEHDNRRARRWLLVSILMHLPFTPLGPLFGLLALLSRTAEAPAPIEQLRGIPVELLEESKPAEQTKVAIEPEAMNLPAPDFTDFPPKKTHRELKKSSELDASVSEDSGINEPVALLDASTAESAVAMIADAGADASTAVAQSSPQSAEEALAAATHGIADSNANIRLNLFMDRVREQPLGTMLGHLLKSVYQWRDFFAPGGLDPVKDFDQILVFGPQLRDSAQVAAFLQHNVRTPRMRGAIDGLVKKSGSESAWLKGTKYPAARAFADRAQRSFVLYPSQVVAVVPPGVEKEALALPSFKLPAAKGDELASAFVKTPWRALLGTGLQLSKSIRSATIKIFPEADGGARIEAVLDDESGEAAERDAKQIRHEVDAATLASNWLLSGSRFAEPVSVRTDDKKIQVALRVTRAQTERLFTLAEGMLTPEGRRATQAARNALLADAGAQRPTRPIPVASAAQPESTDPTPSKPNPVLSATKLVEPPPTKSAPSPASSEP